MRLAVLTHYITSYRISTFAALAKKVDKLTLILSSELSDPKLHDAGIDVQILPSVLIPRKKKHPSGFVETYTVHIPYGVGSALRRFNPDAIHAHELGIRTMAATAYKVLHGKPMVIHADLSEQTERKFGVGRTLLRKGILKFADRVAVNGESGSKYIEGLGFPRDRIDRLPFATDVGVFSNVKPLWRKDGVRRMAYVGRLIPLKGLSQFIEVLSEFLLSRPDLRAEFTMAGGGDESTAIAAVPTPDNLTIHLPGKVPYEKLGDVYANADCFVLPSLCDTWGLVVNESMAAGLPVLGSTLAQAAVELVDEGKSGWLYDPRDRNQMRAAIERFFATPDDQLPVMGQAARASALTIPPDEVAQRFVDQCELAMRSKGELSLSR